MKKFFSLKKKFYIYSIIKLIKIMKLHIERLDGKPITYEIVKSSYFVAVYKNNEFVGTCLTDGSKSAKECYETVINNIAIDELECQEDVKINGSLNY